MINLARARRFGRMAELHTLYLAFILVGFLVQIASSGGGGGKNPSTGGADFEDNEFAEFEEFDDEDKSSIPNAGDPKQAGGGGSRGGGGGSAGSPSTKKSEQNDDGHVQGGFKVPQQQQQQQQQQRNVVEDEEEEDDQDHEGIVEDDHGDEEDSHLKDDEEFENFDKEKSKSSRTGQQKSSPAGGKPAQPQTLKITDVPAHLVNNWSNFQLEMMIIVVLALYLLNYIYGKTKNNSLANAWFETHRELLENNFHIVGDDGTQQEPSQGVLMKDADNSYSLWCTGRQGCSGMLVQLKLLKRQDIISLVMQLFRPKYDRVIVRITLNGEDMDSFVYAFGSKKTLTKLAKDMMDLSTFCTEKKNADKSGLPEKFTIYSEIAEVTSLLMDGKVTSTVEKFAECIDYIHISDQYSGSRPQEGDSQTKLPDTTKVIIFSFNIPGQLSASEQHINDSRPLMSFAFYIFEKVRRMRLSREAKQKADKNRQMAAESFLKTTHAQRQEAAQLRREEKIRERKERVLAEEDPDKQRRMEKQEQKREKKKNQPKVKQLKIKAG